MGRGASCLSDVRTYLSGTAGQGCRLFKLNLTPGQCGVASKAGCLGGVRTYLLPLSDRGAGCLGGVRTSWALWDRGAGCLSSVRTYLPRTVRQGCSLF